MRSITKGVRGRLPINVGDDLVLFQKIKILPIIFTLLIIGCSTRENIRKVEKVEIKKILLTDNTIIESAEILQKSIFESGGSINVVVEKQRNPGSGYGDGTQKRISPANVTLDASRVPLDVLCEQIALRSHTFYKISEDKITFFEPRIPAPFGSYPNIVFGAKGDRPSYFSVSLQGGTPYNPKGLHTNWKEWNFSAEIRQTPNGKFVVFTNRSLVDIPISLTEYVTPNESIEKKVNVMKSSSITVPWQGRFNNPSFTFSIYDDGAFKWRIPETGGRRIR